ncbi:MAG: ABC transporter ATP-binding protein [Ignavibacteria bacterium]|nr:ABC transporter ATP-binding protein [Ignavibacteria bacterium]MCU7502201.1 ABC transporter ATP-binding protein [Ignavibacteria bacterium]MCU7517418.1 ABC transporter ATP-binding protein [Ignavibacteria bacterium]
MFLFLILGLTLIVATANALEPLIMKYIFDRLGGSATTKTIIVGAGLLLGLGLFRDIIGGFSNWLSWRTRLNIQYGLLEATVAKLHRLPADLQRKEGVGAIMTRLDRGITGFMSAITEISFNVLPALTYLVMAVILMLQLDWRLTILVSLFAPLPAIIAAYAAPKQTQREQNLLDRWVRIYSRFNEVLSGIITVRSFAMEDAEKQRFLGNVKDANNLVVRGIGFDSGVSIAQSVTITVARIAAIGFGGFLVLKGQATLGTLVAFISYVGGLFGPVQGLTGIYRTIRTASVSLDQIFSILDTEDFLSDKPDAFELKQCNGEIAFEDVCFKYNKANNEILKGVRLNVKPGEMVAIVGPSGSGKTTLMALLMRFYDPSNGRITMDGVDLKDLKQNWVRKQIGVVLQDALLFNESIRNNIAYGRPNASQSEIEAAAKAANAHEFIMKLENGYDTVAGERGSRLSGGERQRIAIARALLKDAPILILDEATSALDAELEAQVQEALDRLVKGRTTFVIAHRLSTVVNADRILVLKNGRIVEEGCHRDLLSATGYYASLVEKQMKGLAVN